MQRGQCLHSPRVNCTPPSTKVRALPLLAAAVTANAQYLAPFATARHGYLLRMQASKTH